MTTDHVEALYHAIYRVARKIPRGKVATYGQVAELAGIPGGARVAGAAMKVSARLAARQVPWQRVLGKAGPRRGRIAIHDPVGAAVQRGLLEAEGVSVGDTGLIALDRHGWLPGESITVGRVRGASPRRQPRSASKSRASSSRR